MFVFDILENLMLLCEKNVPVTFWYKCKEGLWCLFCCFGGLILLIYIGGTLVQVTKNVYTYEYGLCYYDYYLHARIYIILYIFLYQKKYIYI